MTEKRFTPHTSDNQSSSLEDAVEGGNVQDVRRILKNGNFTPQDTQKAALLAAGNKNIDMLNTLETEGGANLSIKPDNLPSQPKEAGFSPLAVLEIFGDDDVLDGFSDRYDIPSIQDEALVGALRFLAASPDEETGLNAHNKLDDRMKAKIESLVEKGIMPTFGGDERSAQFAYKKIAENGHAATLELLAEHGIVDLDQKDENGQSLRDIMNKGKEPTPTPNSQESNPQTNGFDQANFDARLQQLQDESGRTWTHRGGVANYVFTEVSDPKTAAKLSHDLNNAGVHSVFSGDDIEKGKTIVAIPADELASLDPSRTHNAATATKDLLSIEQGPVSNGLDTGWQSTPSPQAPPVPNR